MITLPDGFDYSALISDFFQVGSAVVAVAAVFWAARQILRSLR
jgi:hypothetical protein